MARLVAGMLGLSNKGQAYVNQSSQREGEAMLGFMAGAWWGFLIRLDGMFGECKAASSSSDLLGPANQLGLPKG